MSPTYDIAMFYSQAVTRSPLLPAGCVAHCFAAYADFRLAMLTPAAIIIRSDDEAYVGALLQQIRHDPDHATALVFTDGNIAAGNQPLSDGPMPPTHQALLDRIGEFQQRARAMRARSDDLTPEALLLEYLWLRPGCVLEPLADWRSPQRYHYPILEALDRTNSDPDVWLQKMDRGGLLEKVALKDRQRECDFCGSAHLNFIDVCPNCRSIDIDQHTALHCFTCGLIAPEERFAQSGKRICPKCGTQLRHIGTDYDRPLETCVCASCDHVFVEGDVVARCAICAHSMLPTALRLHKFYSWRLGATGRLAAQGGHERMLSQDIETNGSSRERFVANLDWVLKLAQNQRDLKVVLLSLRLVNGTELKNALGSENAARLVQAYVERLRELLGDADLMAHTDDETVLMLLTHYDRKHVTELRAGMKTLAERACQEGGIGPTWDVAEVLVNARTARHESAETLLTQLGSTASDMNHTARAA